MTWSVNVIRQNQILREMLEIIFEKNPHIPVYKEEAAFGACIYAHKGGGHISGFHGSGNLIEYLSG